MTRRRDAQPSLWDRPPTPPPPPPNVSGIVVCVCTDGHRLGFTRQPSTGWWVCGRCHRPTVPEAARQIGQPICATTPDMVY